LGEAAGVASAISINDNVTPRNIDVPKLVKTMKDKVDAGDFEEFKLSNRKDLKFK